MFVCGYFHEIFQHSIINYLFTFFPGPIPKEFVFKGSNSTPSSPIHVKETEPELLVEPPKTPPYDHNFHNLGMYYENLGENFSDASGTRNQIFGHPELTKNLF